jgi:hypothetical protein
MIRRLKKEVLGQLPPKRRQVVRLPHPPRDRWPGGMQPGDGEGSDDGDDEEEDLRDRQLEYAPWRVGMGGAAFDQPRREGPAAAGPGSAGAPYAQPGVAVAAGSNAGAEGQGQQAQQPPVLTAEPPRMSGAHRTALAKLPDVLEWLVGMLEG